MKNQTYRMTMLFDFYGELLTDRQKEFYDLYYNEDLSLAEIAENVGITRQGVRDIIVRAEAYLTEIEDKTGLIRRFHKMQAELVEMGEHLAPIERDCNDPSLGRHIAALRRSLDMLRQEAL